MTPALTPTAAALWKHPFFGGGGIYIGTWTISSGSLPDGLNLDGDTISGKPTTPQTAAFQITFTDDSGRIASQAESITVTSGGPAVSGAIQDLSDCRQSTIAANDDDSTAAVALPFPVNFFGTTYTATYISNNGYIVFDAAQNTYTPFPLIDEQPTPIIAPFFGDVDTRNPGYALVTYGSSPDHHTFCVNWVDVGYYNQHVDKLNSFQLLLTDRSDVASGDFDITFNFGTITWETGDASGGTGGIGGSPARAGYSAGTGAPGTSIELPGPGTPAHSSTAAPTPLSPPRPAGREPTAATNSRSEIDTPVDSDTVLEELLAPAATRARPAPPRGHPAPSQRQPRRYQGSLPGLDKSLRDVRFVRSGSQPFGSSGWSPAGRARTMHPMECGPPEP